MSDKKLTERELSRLNLDESAYKLAELTATNAALELKVLELQQKLLSLEIIAKRNHVSECKTAATACKIVVVDNLKTLAKKKDLKTGWGYHPESGEIIEN